MKREYSEAKLEIVVFDNEDIITTSQVEPAPPVLPPTYDDVEDGDNMTEIIK